MPLLPLLKSRGGGVSFDFITSTSLSSLFTFTRASNATFFNESGALTTASTDVPRFDYDPSTARTNLLAFSAAFEDAYWTKTGITAFGSGSVANTTATQDPFGGFTAEYLRDTTANSFHAVQRTLTGLAANQQLTLSVYIKAAELTFAAIRIGEVSTSNTVTAGVNLTTGATSSANGGTGSGVSATTTSVGNGWWRVEVEGVPSSGTGDVQVTIGCQTSLSTGFTYTGTGTQGIYVFGAQLETGTSATAYIATTGVVGPRTNTIIWSNAFNNAAWVASNSGAGSALPVVTPNFADGPNGEPLGATRVQLNHGGAGGGFSGLTFTVTSASSCKSLWVRSRTGTVTLQLFTSSTDNTTVTSAWQRLSAVNTSSGFRIMAVQSFGNTQVCDLEVFGAQNEIGATTAGPFIPTNGFPVTVNHGTVCNLRSLLLEGARTNLTGSSQTYDATWFVSAATATQDQTGLDGTTSAFLFAEDSTSASHGLGRSGAGTFSATSGTAYTSSIYAKAGTCSTFQIIYSGAFDAQSFANFDLGAGTVGTVGTSATARITNVGGGWYRCEVTATANSTASAFAFYGTTQNATSTRYPSFLGTGRSLTLFGAQTEAASFASSYIVTTTTAATRAADSCLVNNTNFPGAFANVNNECTFLAEVTPMNASTATAFMRILNASASADTNRLAMRVTGGGTTVAAEVESGGVIQATISNGTLTSGVTSKIAAAFRLDDCAVSTNGAAVTTDTSATMPSGIDRLRLGADGSGGNNFYGWFRRLQYFPSRQPNATLQALST